MVKLEPCNEATAAYVAGYIYKKLSKDKHQEAYGKKPRPFQTQSKDIGMLHCLENWETYKSQGYLTQKGIKYALPRFYKNLIGTNPVVRDAYIRKANAEQEAEYKARGLDYYSKEALELRRGIRAQNERNIIRKMEIDEDLRDLRKKGNR